MEEKMVEYAMLVAKGMLTWEELKELLAPTSIKEWVTTAKDLYTLVAFFTVQEELEKWKRSGE